ncbi:MAG: transcriptional regulator, LysR family [Firmicutes bacterium]|nr:transcriptional regulator, LysR family [Bacillota bacterium]
MELRQIRYFISAAEYLNFTEAAKHLFITQPTLSQQIAELEEYLDVKLFDRNGRSIRLTVAGEVFLKEAKEIIIKTEEAVAATRRIRSGLIGNIKIGFMAEAAKKFLPQFVAKFRQRYSNIDLSLTQYTLWPLTNALRHGQLDIACMLAFNLDKKDFAWKTLYTDFLAAVVRYDHPLANEKTITLSAIAEEPFVLMSRDEGPAPIDQLVKAFADRGITPKVVSHHRFMESVLMSIESGIGISILPRCVEAYTNPNLRFLDLGEDSTAVDVVVAWKKENSNPLIPLFIKELDNSAQPVT